MARIWGRSGQVNRLDYVTCWLHKAARYSVANRSIEITFVATNSITQGEQCGILWSVLFGKDLSIRYAHRTFQWNSEARGKATVHCVIVGLTFAKDVARCIYEYEHVRGEPHASEVTRINGYLIDGPQYAVPARSAPPVGRLKMHKGSQPTDGARLKKPGGGYLKYSNLILDSENRDGLLAADPNCERWLKPYVGGEEMISGQWRWCLWLKNANPSELKASKPIVERLGRVRAGRLQSPTASVSRICQLPNAVHPGSAARHGIPRHSKSFIGDTGVHSDQNAAAYRDSFRPASDYPRRAASLFRHSHVCDAHVLDAGGHRTTQERLSVCDCRIQFVPLAGDDKHPVLPDRDLISSRSRCASQVSCFVTRCAPRLRCHASRLAHGASQPRPRCGPALPSLRFCFRAGARRALVPAI